MRIALAQLDSRLGDVTANADRGRTALEADADLVVFPELYLSGYAVAQAGPETARTAAEAAAVAGGTRPAAVLGFHERNGTATYNSAVYVEDGAPAHVQRKLYLVDYAPFNEDAAFEPGSELRAFDAAGARVAILICNDAWQPFLPFLAVQDGAQVLLLPSSSSDAVPEAEEYWRELTRFYARMLQCWVVFVNRVGTEAGLTFWGGSHVVDPWGRVVAEAPRHEEAILVADLDPELAKTRRHELPLLRNPRIDLLRRELERLARTRDALQSR